ncbi:aspartyl beta-hydroxylase [Pseudolysobacter antarcticus]|uniref:Aspartyl beta-hydroxylase n=1 Tax=Pseudolysobacter antarcticus TaxID=2511995 RepID=A0A411HF25_9GAMM|nr:aspartyl/asparaginyl beta-hydroxylase domain-containing protein [Pseudolysobacter antarcticus]QBB69090.1 aspartyl beta-hydroxylase [Pseudolysobacter antarcticus]
MNSAASGDIGALLEHARQLAQQGQGDQAEQICAQILQTQPSQVEALNFIAMRALGRGQFAQATNMLQLADLAQPNAQATLKNLAVVHAAAGDREAAEKTLQQAIEAAPEHYDLQLHLGGLQEQRGDGRAALRTYLRAITAAQNQGYWLSAASTPPALHAAVTHAMDFVHRGRQQILSAVLQPLRAQHGAAAMLRIERCLAMYLGDVPSTIADAYQKPKFLYFPDLPTRAYFASDLFPWQVELEKHTDIIRAEMQALLTEPDALEPFLGVPTPAEGDQYLRGGSQGAPAWDAFFFYRHGERQDANCARCPQTAAIIDALPIVRIREHAPEICFSVLTPGTHILPHHGVTNTRLVTHLPLIVPEDCAIRVGGEEHSWQEGRCVTFDDTFEHEAWNRSQSTRVVLILDSWNPYLTEVERIAVTDLVGAIGDFNREFSLRGG